MGYIWPLFIIIITPFLSDKVMRINLLGNKKGETKKTKKKSIHIFSFLSVIGENLERSIKQSFIN